MSSCTPRKTNTLPSNQNSSRKMNPHPWKSRCLSNTGNKSKCKGRGLQRSWRLQLLTIKPTITNENSQEAPKMLCSWETCQQRGWYSRRRTPFPRCWIAVSRLQITRCWEANCRWATSEAWRARSTRFRLNASASSTLPDKEMITKS